MQIIEPKSPEEFKKYYQLRYDVLRKPWNQPKDSEKDESDSTSFHRMMVDEETGNPIAVGRLHLNSSNEAQIRYMAVSDYYQGNGNGSRMVKALEEIAKKNGMRKIILQSRENAVPFYERNGYEIIEKSYRLFDEIQHWLMGKDLTTEENVFP